MGKSCLIKRYCEQRFVSRYISTIGVDFGVRAVHVDVPSAESSSASSTSTSSPSPSSPATRSLEVKVNFWDLSGDPSFFDIRNEFYSDTQGALLVFDVTDAGSFAKLDQWLLECEQHGGRPLLTVVVGNKADEPSARRQVTEAEARRWAETRRLPYYETSAKSGAEVNRVFSELLHAVVEASLAAQRRCRPTGEGGGDG